jgi:hypothetical protein
VVHRGERQIRTAYLSVAESQPLERLWGCDFVNEVRVDIENRYLVCGGAHEMRLPYFFVHGFFHNFSFIFVLFVLMKNKNVPSASGALLQTCNL